MDIGIYGILLSIRIVQCQIIVFFICLYRYQALIKDRHWNTAFSEDIFTKLTLIRIETILRKQKSFLP